MNGCSARQLLIAVVKSKLIRDSDLVSFHRAQIMLFSLMGQGLCAPSCGYSSSSCLPLTLTHVYTFSLTLQSPTPAGGVRVKQVRTHPHHLTLMEQHETFIQKSAR